MIDLSGISAEVHVGGSPEEMVQKALTSQTASTSALWLNNSQADSFVRLVVDQTAGLQMAQTVMVEGPGYEVSNMDINTGYYAVGLAGNAQISSSDEVTPTFAERELNPKNYDVRLPIEQTQLMRWNIERERLNQTADDLLAIYVGNILEDEAWNSVAGGSAPSWLTHSGTGAMTQIDGWLQIATQAGHTVDFSGARMGSEVFRQMLRAMPNKWRRGNLKWFVSPNTALEWNHFIYRHKATNLGDNALVSDSKNPYYNIPVETIPMIRDDYDGVGALSGTTSSYTKVLLTDPSNLVIGYNPMMRIFTHPRDDGKVLYLNYWGAFDVEIINVDACVIGYNITPQAATSLT